jgi:uncharacterized protein (DUF2147 family)
MRSLPVSAATFLLMAILPAGSAAAAELQPIGEWRTANGLANIKIDDCDGVLWGVISWEKEPGVDSNNPNPAERNHPILGLPILRAMKPTKPNLWQGEVYNAENGKTYDAKISLASQDVLKIEGCVLGFLCGGENWSRVKADAAPPQKPPAQQQRAGQKNTPPPAPVLSACAGLTRGQK